MKNRDMVSWTASISQNAGHGEGIEAMEDDGLKPDGEFCINFLAACCHEGKVEAGVAFFESMANELGIVPDFRHFHALANLFVQSGLFDEASDVLGSMPECRKIVGWTSVLSGCKRYGNAEVGQACFGSIAAPKGTIDVWKTGG
jgi:pentatricopeptide repeat protein